MNTISRRDALSGKSSTRLTICRCQRRRLGFINWRIRTNRLVMKTLRDVDSIWHVTKYVTIKKTLGPCKKNNSFRRFIPEEGVVTVTIWRSEWILDNDNNTELDVQVVSCTTKDVCFYEVNRMRQERIEYQGDRAVQNKVLWTRMSFIWRKLELLTIDGHSIFLTENFSFLDWFLSEALVS